MRGHIVKRSQNSYTIVLSLGIDPAIGKRKQQWVSVKGTKKEAEKRLAELLHQLDNGIFSKPDKTTLANYLKRWLTEYCRPNLAPHTTESYEFFICRHLIPSLGQIPLAQLKPEHLQCVYSNRHNHHHPYNLLHIVLYHTYVLKLLFVVLYTPLPLHHIQM